MSEWIKLVRATLPRLGRAPVAFRGAVLLSSIVAVLATVLPSWDVPDGYVYVALIGAVVATIAPDSGGGLFIPGALIVAWASGAGDASIGPAVILAALALLVGHVAGALAAAMPATADADTDTALRWWRPTAVLAGAVVATAALVALLDALNPPGSIVIVIAALVVAAGGAWWWSAEPDD